MAALQLTHPTANGGDMAEIGNKIAVWNDSTSIWELSSDPERTDFRGNSPTLLSPDGSDAPLRPGEPPYITGTATLRTLKE